MDDLHLTLEHFDGPLSLLLHLIEKNDIDIYDIEISLLTEQFLSYLEKAEKNRIELSSEFVVMASNLLEIKARMLLPGQNEAYKDLIVISEEDPRYDLMQRLIEYKQFKKISDKLQEMYDINQGRRVKDKKSLNFEKQSQVNLDGINPHILAELYKKLLLRMPLEDENRKGFFQSIERDSISLEEKTENIIAFMSEAKKAKFMDLLENAKSVDELVVGFLSVLNLMKDKVLDAVQNKQYGDIDIEFLGLNQS